MTPRQLRYFCGVAEAASFAAAARSLHISQPSLSQQIAKLEDELDVPLFIRQARGVELTEAGEKLFDHAQSILRQIDAAKADVSSSAENPQGTVRVGMTQASCNLLPLYLVDDITRSYPGIDLDINAGQMSTLLQDLREGAIDIAVLSPEQADTGDMVLHPLIRERLLFVSKSQEIDLPLRGRGKKKGMRFKDLAPYEFILPSRSRDSIGSTVNRAERETGIQLRKRAGLGQLMTNLSFVLAGECECLLPWTAIYHLVDAGLVTAVPVIDPPLQRDVCIAILREKPLTAAAQKTIAVIKDSARRAHAQGRWKGELLLTEARHQHPKHTYPISQ